MKDNSRILEIFENSMGQVQNHCVYAVIAPNFIY